MQIFVSGKQRLKSFVEFYAINIKKSRGKNLILVALLIHFFAVLCKRPLASSFAYNTANRKPQSEVRRLSFDVTRIFNFSNASLVFLQNKGFRAFLSSSKYLFRIRSSLSLQAWPVNTTFLSFVLNTVERMLAITSHSVAHRRLSCRNLRGKHHVV